jgi:Tol biopolymer transport system component
LTPTAVPVKLGNLTNNPAKDFNPKWSPDGSKIAFVSDRNGSNGLYIMNSNGSGLIRLGDQGLYPRFAWSPDGNKMVFGNVELGETTIYTVRIDGTGLTRILNNIAYATPSWSSDGNRVIISIDLGLHSRYLIIDPDGKNPNFIENVSYMVDFSPDGKKIAYLSSIDGEIYVQNLDSNYRINITNHPAGDKYPTWSPDSKKIAFSSERNGNWEIYVVNADGTQLERLTNNNWPDTHPEFANKTLRILYKSIVKQKNAFNIININGLNYQIDNVLDKLGYSYCGSWSPKDSLIVCGGYKKVSILTNEGKLLSTIHPKMDSYGYPEWLTAYQLILFDYSGNGENLLMGADGFLAKVNIPNSFSSPDISPNGKFITYYSGISGNLEIYIMSIDDNLK